MPKVQLQLWPPLTAMLASNLYLILLIRVYLSHQGRLLILVEASPAACQAVPNGVQWVVCLENCLATLSNPHFVPEVNAGWRSCVWACIVLLNIRSGSLSGNKGQVDHGTQGLTQWSERVLSGVVGQCSLWDPQRNLVAWTYKQHSHPVGLLWRLRYKLFSSTISSAILLAMEIILIADV